MNTKFTNAWRGRAAKRLTAFVLAFAMVITAAWGSGALKPTKVSAIEPSGSTWNNTTVVGTGSGGNVSTSTTWSPDHGMKSFTGLASSNLSEVTTVSELFDFIYQFLAQQKEANKWVRAGSSGDGWTGSHSESVGTIQYYNAAQIRYLMDEVFGAFASVPLNTQITSFSTTQLSFTNNTKYGWPGGNFISYKVDLLLVGAFGTNSVGATQFNIKISQVDDCSGHHDVTPAFGKADELTILSNGSVLDTVDLHNVVLQTGETKVVPAGMTVYYSSFGGSDFNPTAREYQCSTTVQFSTSSNDRTYDAWKHLGNEGIPASMDPELVTPPVSDTLKPVVVGAPDTASGANNGKEYNPDGTVYADTNPTNDNNQLGGSQDLATAFSFTKAITAASGTLPSTTDFTFTLSSVDGYSKSVTVPVTAGTSPVNVVFPGIVYDAIGTHYYTLTETAVSAPWALTTQKVNYVKVVVTKEGASPNFYLVATVTYSTDTANIAFADKTFGLSTNPASPTFNNTYTPPTAINVLYDETDEGGGTPGTPDQTKVNLKKIIQTTAPYTYPAATFTFDIALTSVDAVAATSSSKVSFAATKTIGVSAGSVNSGTGKSDPFKSAGTFATFSEAGTYVFHVVEQAAGSGWTANTQSYDITVVIGKAANVLSVTSIAYSPGTAAAFTNVYTNTPTGVVVGDPDNDLDDPDGEEFTDTPPTNGGTQGLDAAFTFTKNVPAHGAITPDTGNFTFEYTLTGAGNGYSETAGVNFGKNESGNKTFSFPGIVYEYDSSATYPLTYNYTLTETAPGNGWTVAPTTRTYAVTVVVDVNETDNYMTAVVTYGGGAKPDPAFTNTYAAKPAIVDEEDGDGDGTQDDGTTSDANVGAGTAFTVNKTIDGATFTGKSGDFSFTLAQTAGPGYESFTPVEATNNGTDTTKAKFPSFNLNEAGVYEYLITEVDPGENAYIYATDEYRVVITVVDNGEGQLLITSKEFHAAGEYAGLNFDNRTYASTAINASISAVKTATGPGGDITLAANKFTFYLHDEAGLQTPPTVVNKAGTSTGAAVEFVMNYTAEGEYLYRLAEETDLPGGWTSGGEQYVAKVVVTETLGVLSAVVTYYAYDNSGLATSAAGTEISGADVVFTNTYATTPAYVGENPTDPGKPVESGDPRTPNDPDHPENNDPSYGAFSFTKTVNQNAANANFSFTVTPKEKDPSDGAVEHLNGASVAPGNFNLNSANFELGWVKFTKPGTYVYEVKETALVTPKGWTISTTVYTVTVTVTDNGAGKLVAAVATTPDAAKTFVNTYAPKKVVMGDPDEPGDTENPGEGGDPSGGTANAKGALAFTKVVTGDGVNQATDKAGFKFTLTGTGNAAGIVRHAVSAADGSITFKGIGLTAAKNYTFTLTEDLTTAQKAAGWKLVDKQSWTVTVNVLDDGEGALYISSITYNYGDSPAPYLVGDVKVTNHKGFTPIIVGEDPEPKTPDDPETPLKPGDGTEEDISEGGTNPNGGTDTLKAALTFAKEFSPTTAATDGFAFTLTGAGLAARATTNASGVVKFTGLVFTKPGEYVFTLTEDDLTTAQTKAGYTKDASDYKVTIKVGADEDGDLKVDHIEYWKVGTPDNETNRDAIVFTNNWTDPGYTPAYVGEISENSKKDKDKIYKNKHVKGPVENDEGEVTDPGDLRFEGDDDNAPDTTFAAFRFNKVVAGHDPNKSFTFTLTPKADYSAGSEPRLATTATVAPSIYDGNTASFGFGWVEYKLPGTYVYTVKETTTDGNGWKVDTNEYTVTVTVSVVGDTKDLSASVVVTQTKAGAVTKAFNNVYSATPIIVGPPKDPEDPDEPGDPGDVGGGEDIDNPGNGGELSAKLTFEKKVSGEGAVKSGFRFELSNGDIKRYATSDENGAIKFAGITFKTAGEYTFTLKEIVPTPPTTGWTYDTAVYNVIVNVTDDGEGNLVAVVDYKLVNADKDQNEVTFTNTYNGGGGSSAPGGESSASGGESSAAGGGLEASPPVVNPPVTYVSVTPASPAPSEVTEPSNPTDPVPDASTEPGGTEPGGTEPGGTEPGGTEPGGPEPGGTEPGGTNPVVPRERVPWTPGNPGGIDPNVAPIPMSATSTLVPNDDGTFLELDLDGTPLGTWRFDDDLGEWVFDPLPLGAAKANPKTGDRDNGIVDGALLLGGAAVLLAGMAARRRKQSDQ